MNAYTSLPTETLVSNPAVTVTRVPHRARLSLRARGDLAPLEKALGHRLPREIGGVTLGTACLGPDEWLIMTDDAGALIPEPWPCAFLSAAAPNAGALRKNAPALLSGVRDVYRRRVLRVLDVFRCKGRRSLVLGAWGCGVFGNDPRACAEAFRDMLADERFAGAFDHVRFAIYEPGGAAMRNIAAKR